MADLTITAASVVPDTGFGFFDGTAGATITAGQLVYKDTSDSDKLKLADANASAATAVVAGIALHAASANQPLRVMTSGTVTIGATVARGTIYVASATAGGIAPSTDLASGWYTTVLGIATSTTKISLGLKNGGVTVP